MNAVARTTFDFFVSLSGSQSGWQVTGYYEAYADVCD